MFKYLIFIISLVASLGSTVQAELPAESEAPSISPLKPESWLSKNQDKLKTALLYGAVYGIHGVQLAPNGSRDTVLERLGYASCCAFGGYLFLEVKERFKSYPLLNSKVSQEPVKIGAGQSIFNIVKKGFLYLSILAPVAIVVEQSFLGFESNRVGGIKTSYVIPVAGLIGVLSSVVHVVLLGSEKLYNWAKPRRKTVSAN